LVPSSLHTGFGFLPTGDIRGEIPLILKKPLKIAIIKGEIPLIY
jgi:hypothetical protein